jgi:hypothetical protein
MVLSASNRQAIALTLSGTYVPLRERQLFLSNSAYSISDRMLKE